MLVILFFLLGMGIVYPAIAYGVWFTKYRKSVSLKEFWRNV